MEIIQPGSISHLQKESIFRLWNEEYPSTIIYTEIKQLDDYLEQLSDVKHYFLAAAEDEIAGWAITFRRDNKTWFAIIISSSFQGKGSGATLLNHLKEKETELNGWVIETEEYVKADGTPYNPPLAFYLKNGFCLVKDARLEIPQMKAVKICWKREI